MPGTLCISFPFTIIPSIQFNITAIDLDVSKPLRCSGASIISHQNRTIVAKSHSCMDTSHCYFASQGAQVTPGTMR